MSATHRPMSALRAQRDEGMTIVELIIVIILMGILLGAAAAGFNAQRTASWERSVRTDLTTWANAADAHFRGYFFYPTSTDGFAQSGNVPTVSENNTGVAFVVRSGVNAGYVLFATNSSSGVVYAYSSFDRDSGPVRTELAHLPSLPPVEGYGLPEGLDAQDWSTAIAIP